MTTSVNLGLDHVSATNAGAYVSVNTTFNALDVLAMLVVEDLVTVDEPLSPSNGESWAIPSSGTITGTTWAAEASHGDIARYYDGWYFTPAKEGWAAYDLNTSTSVVFDGVDWVSASAAHTHAASDIISGTFDDARISSTSVVQHEIDLTIDDSQIVGISGGSGINYASGVISIDSSVLTTSDGLADLSDVSAAAQTDGFALMSSGGPYAGRAIAVGDLGTDVTNWLAGNVVIDQISAGTVSPAVAAQIRVRLQLFDGSYLGTEWDCRLTLFDDITNYNVVQGTFGDNNGDAQVAVHSGGTSRIYAGDAAGNFKDVGYQDYYYRSQSNGEILIDITGETAKSYGLRAGPPKWEAYPVGYSNNDTPFEVAITA